VVCKGARLVDFQGQKQMTLTEYSSLMVEPIEVSKCADIRQWWTTINQSEIKSLNFGVEAKEPGQKPDSIRLIQEVQEVFQNDQQAL